MLVHPDLDSWISLDRTGEPQKLARGVALAFGFALFSVIIRSFFMFLKSL